MATKIRYFKSFELVPRENIKIMRGIPLCCDCLEYNNINYEALKDLAKQLNNSIVNINPQMKEQIKQKEQERRAKIKVIY